MAPGGRLPWFSSTRLFQALQAEHCPAHLEWTAPQVWQMKAEPSRAMEILAPANHLYRAERL
jgi:hypothetical protein